MELKTILQTIIEACLSKKEGEWDVLFFKKVYFYFFILKILNLSFYRKYYLKNRVKDKIRKKLRCVNPCYVVEF